jgi:hypothetical protein
MILIQGMVNLIPETLTWEDAAMLSLPSAGLSFAVMFYIPKVPARRELARRQGQTNADGARSITRMRFS